MNQPTLVYGFLMAMGLFIACWFLFVVPSERRDHERKLALLQKRIAEREARLRQAANGAVTSAGDNNAQGPAILETERLLLRKMTVDDASFLLQIVNDVDFLRYIGDRGVRNIDDARAYLLRGPIDSYRRHGFGMYLVIQKADGSPAGMCGLVCREGFDDPDIGFALLPLYRSRGYASEAASAVLAYGSGMLNLTRILAIATPDNAASNRILTKAGMSANGTVCLPGDQTVLNLYVYET